MKELPYFKFHVSEYLNGSITLEELNLQGLFINICAWYWFKDCRLTLAEAKQRISKGKANAFDSLFKSGLIKIENDFLRISFLDQQWKEREIKSKINSHNGGLGGRPKKSETKANGLNSESETKANQKAIRKEQEQEQERDKKQTAFGPTHSHFVVVKSKYLHEATARINGKAGLIEYMEHNQTVLNLPEHADKFMRANNGKVFNELSHLQNAYSLYIEKQYK